MNKIEKNKGVDDNNNDSSQHEHKNDGGTDTLQDWTKIMMI